MNKNSTFGHDTQAMPEKTGLLQGNFMSLTLIYGTCLFLINLLTIILIFD